MFSLLQSLPIDWTEIAKLVLTFLFGLIAAWLAARWALHRYQQEKIWERRMTVFADILTAIAERQSVLSKWMDADMLHYRITDDVSESLRVKYRDASAKIDTLSAVSEMLLPKSVSTCLSDLRKKIEAIDNGDPYLDHDAEWGLLNEAKKTLIEIAKREFSIR